MSYKLWDIGESLLPKRPPSPQGGRPRVADRAALSGIIFVLKTGIPCHLLPAEMGCGFGVTCGRRLRDRQATGVWDRLHRVLRERLAQADQLDWRRAAREAHSLAAKKGGRQVGPNPTDRGKSGAQQHLAVELHGVPLTVEMATANWHHSMLSVALRNAFLPCATVDLDAHDAGRLSSTPIKPTLIAAVARHAAYPPSRRASRAAVSR